MFVAHGSDEDDEDYWSPDGLFAFHIDFKTHCDALWPLNPLTLTHQIVESPSGFDYRLDDSLLNTLTFSYKHYGQNVRHTLF